ncbi:MAG TPA: hypothetical protein VGF48_06455 [Thermoanaerobaculia bacterium]|jgi:hypothetical protein
MAADPTLSELTASLVQELAHSAAEVDRGQREQFVALAREAAMPEEEFCERWVGRTPPEKSRLLERYIGGVFSFIPALIGRATKGLASHLIPLDDDARKALIDDLGDDVVPAIEAAPVKGIAWCIAREKLEQLVSKKLRNDAAQRHRELKATLRARLPKVEMSSGTVSVKVLLRETDGKVTARLATPESVAKSSEAVSTVTVEFTVGAFPSLEA